MLKFAFVIVAVLLVAVEFTAAARITRDVSPEIPDTGSDKLTAEKVGKFFAKIYRGIKAQIDKVATPENMNKLSKAMDTAGNKVKRIYKSFMEEAKKSPAPV